MAKNKNKLKNGKQIKKLPKIKKWIKIKVAKNKKWQKKWPSIKCVQKSDPKNGQKMAKMKHGQNTKKTKSGQK